MSRLLLPVLLLVAVFRVGSVDGQSPTDRNAIQAVLGPAAAVNAGSPPVDDPFPIRRLRVRESQFSESLKLLEPGPLVRLPRDEFENRVRASAIAASEAKLTPRIVDAKFKASLVGADLIGTGEMEIVNPGAVSRLLPLDPLRFAFGAATWSDGRPAVVGVPTGGNVPAVWVENGGRDTLKFNWSATSISEPGERRFELRMPMSSTAILELDLPLGLIPAVPPEVLLTGPFPTGGTPAQMRWAMRFGGRTRLDIALRPAGNPGVTAAAILTAKYELTLGQINGGFEYELRPSLGTVGEWVFTVDPGLRVIDVVVNNRAGWVVDPAPGPGMPRRLRVTLRQPGAGGKVLITAVAPYPDPSRAADAPLPAVRPMNAVITDETLELRLAPGLHIEEWNTGGYRLIDSQIGNDQVRTLTLSGTLLPPGSDALFRRLPTVVSSASDQEYTTAERVMWYLDSERVTAVLRVTVRVRRGSLFGFPLRLPPGYRLLRADSVPESFLFDLRQVGDIANIDFARPLSAGQSVDLIFESRGPNLISGNQRLPFPSFSSIGAIERVGVLGVYVGSAWTTDFLAAAGTTRGGWFDLSGPSVPTGAAGIFRYQGCDLDGTAEIVPAKPVFTVEIEANRDGGDGLIATRYTVVVQAGTLPFLAATATAGSYVPTWRVIGRNAATAVECVPLELIMRRSIPSVAWWPGNLQIITFARPVNDQVILEALTAQSNSKDMPPFLAIVGTTHTRTTSRFENRPKLPSSTGDHWEFRRVQHITAVRSTEAATVVFEGTVSAAKGSVVPVTLPPGAIVEAASVGGKWIEPGDLQTTAGGVLSLPLPAQLPTRFEVRYSLAVERLGPIGTARSPNPTLPGDPEIKRMWVFASNLLPCRAPYVWERGESNRRTASPIDPPLNLGVDPFTVLSSAEEHQFASTQAADAVGVCFAGLLLLLGWVGVVRRHPVFVMLLLGALSITIAAHLVFPPWWQRAALPALAVGLIATAVVVIVRGHRSRLPGAAALVVLICSISDTSTHAQPSGPTTVLLIPSGTTSETVVVPKSVLERLANNITVAQPGTIITAAEYAVTEEDAAARVVAKFKVHALQQSEPRALLPLSDARLERVTVNGVPAFPSVLRPGVYSVPLPGLGRHEIEARFLAAVVGTPSEREIRFGVPEVPNSSVAVDLPIEAKQSQVVGRLGRQTIIPGNRQRIEAELGTVKSVQIRRRDGAAGAASVKVREGCIWDVSEDGAELTAAYLVRVEQGTVGSLRFDVPSELEPLSVSVRSLEPGGAASLRDWSLGNEQGSRRALKLDLQEAIAGRVLVVLSLAPRKPPTSQPVLRFPRVAITGVGTAEPEAAYGIRVKGVTLDEITRSGAIDFSPDALTRDFAAVAELRLEPNTPVRVFRPTASGAAELRPTLRVAIEPPGFTIDTNWNLGLQRGVGNGTVRWSGKESVTLLSFTLAGVLVSEIRGSEVAGWSQVGGRVLVWLKRSLKEGEIAWTGKAVVASPFEVQTPRLAEGRLISDTVRVRPAEGLTIRVERDRGWSPAATLADPVSYRTANSAFPPIRVSVVSGPDLLHRSELGWLGSPSGVRSHIQEPPSQPPAPKSPAVQAGSSASQPQESLEEWSWPVLVVLGWVAAAFLLAVLMFRSPRSTWPEQSALIAGMFGELVAVGWWLGPAVWCVARFVWLVEAIVTLIPVPKR